jgi:predicted O-linked N-acetylglucosamine transferase (SPINDLY family)
VTRSLGRRREMCEWDDFNSSASPMRALLERDQAGLLPPFLFLSAPGVSAQEQRACSELWTRDRIAASLPERDKLDFQFALATRDKLRIAYLSNDFHDHATSRLLIETFEAHDRKRFEVHAFSFGGADGGTMRRLIRNSLDVFHDITELSDNDAARAVHDAGIDILIDLKGYTRGARTGIMMLHPAPVQVNYLGYPGTLGANICDYIITDRFITPIATASAYSEAFAYMPHSYQPHGRSVAIDREPVRSEVGLPETGFVFCCFNQAYKFTPPLFDLWCRLLEAVPGSILWLLADERVQGNLRCEALQRGIEPDRLVFAPHTIQSDHLSRLQHADLVLDTSPFGAHTTASDALWAGVPIVTCAGDTFPSRVAGSLLHAVGLPELIASNEDDYFAVALALATEPGRLGACKAKLRGTRMTAPLFDVAAYTIALENLYEIMWERRCSGAGRMAIGAPEMSEGA